MQTRQLGFTDLHLTTVGFGAASIGGGSNYGFAHRDETESIATIHRALELGINWIDTAPAYGKGHAEELVGRALADWPERVFIATKCGSRWREDNRGYASLKADSIREEVEASLRRMNVEVIDLYQVHWPHPDEDLEEGWATIADLIRAGKVRYAGASNFSVAQLKRVQAIHPVAALQPPYSMLDRRIEADLLPFCAENDIGVIIYSPMQSGLLTGKFTRDVIEGLEPGDWRLRQPQFKEPQLSANLDFIDKLRQIAARYARPLAQLAIAWTLSRPEVTSAIVGARRPRQIEESAPAGDWALPDALLAEIEALYQACYDEG